MIILGLTGSIGMGKTTAANQLRWLKIPVFDADEAVHRLLARNGAAVPLIEAAFPNVAFGGAIERERLAARVFGQTEALKTLEGILHPLVHAEERAFVAKARRRHRPIVALDIPLLFETSGQTRTDAVAVVSCPAFLQEHRVLKRPGMTRSKLASIRRRQMPDDEKRRRADFIIPTGLGKRAALIRLKAILRQLRPARSKG